ncbi:MAG TPA: methyltransferase [Steroidobacteraceae bacterium]|nr:methyltransferase [Steroidobacteraceae bacterium]
MNTLTAPAPDSIKAYSPLGLAVYDALIMNGVAPLIWDCPSSRLVDHYREHLGAHHADVGVGTGYCLDHAGVDLRRLALIDLQPHCLAHTARRLARFRPDCHRRDVLQPVRGIGPAFDSIALNGVLHCLAGDLRDKARVFDHLAPLARPGTKLFGCTLISDHIAARWRRRAVHGLLNQLRVIDNRRDIVADLHTALEARYVDCRIEVVGCMALFSAETK